jgi:hypothetical protein
MHTRLRVHRAPGIPHALIGRKFINASGALRREDETITTSLRAQRSNPSRGRKKDGLLRCARNDGGDA